MLVQRLGKFLEILVGTELRIYRAMIDDVVTVDAAGVRLGDGRQVAVADAEVVQVADQRRRSLEIEIAMKLQAVGAAGNSGAHVGQVLDAPRSGSREYR